MPFHAPMSAGGARNEGRIDNRTEWVGPFTRTVGRSHGTVEMLLSAVMNAQQIVPILNVSDMAETFAWFEKWGWRKLWDWGSPPTFGAVGSGQAEIFLCLNGQGGRGRGANTTTFQNRDDQAADRGAWMSVFVEDVDAVHRQCVAAGLDVTFPPTNMEWRVREMHVRHPDGHVFRVGTGREEE
jgi:catechol 2,3-dioxygenase-like lactoylglutathione lyase family enzyme